MSHVKVVFLKNGANPMGLSPMSIDARERSALSCRYENLHTILMQGMRNFTALDNIEIS